MAELQPTYGNFELRGQVVWKGRPNSYRTGTNKSGNGYRGIQFGIKTADKNIVQVDLFSNQFDEVKLQNKETKERDKTVPYGQHTGELPEGYKLFMPIHLGLEQDDDGNNVKKQLIPYDAVEYINNNLQDGDTVFVFGSNRYSTYPDREGNIRNKQEFEIRGVFKSSIDFDDEEFTGTSIFDQELIINKSEKKEDKLLINAYIITDNNGTFIPFNFFIDINKYKDFALNVKRLKFGSRLKVKGLIHHTVVEQEVESTGSAWGEEPSGKGTVTKVFKELEITKAEKPNKEDIGLYSPEDFVKKQKPSDNPFEESEQSDKNEWGDEPSNNDPFFDSFSDNSGSIDISDDDLPF